MRRSQTCLITQLTAKLCDVMCICCYDDTAVHSSMHMVHQACLTLMSSTPSISEQLHGQTGFIDVLHAITAFSHNAGLRVGRAMLASAMQHAPETAVAQAL